MSSTIVIISGGTGASASLLLNTILVQFPGQDLKIEICDHVRQPDQLETALELAEASGALIVHSLVQDELRQRLISAAQQRGLKAIDLTGELLDALSKRLNIKPLGRPGLYRLHHQEELNRAAAINYTINHDDGLHPEDLAQAEIVILGVSRSGKTPLSMYLGVQGWWVANLPLVAPASLPAELGQVDAGRLIGLLAAPETIQTYRRQRQQLLKLPGAYSDLRQIFDELEQARQIYRKLGVSVIDINHKPIETCADEIIVRLGDRMGAAARRHQESERVGRE